MMMVIAIKISLCCFSIATSHYILFAAAFFSSLPFIVDGDSRTKTNDHNTCIPEAADERCILPNEDTDDGKHKIHVYGEENIHQLYEKALDIFISVVNNNPKAVILLPTGSTPKPFYKLLIDKFANDEEELDLSEITVFNLDEYVGLPSDHPLSYHYFMEINLYGPLRTIDPKRAPKKEHIHIPGEDTIQNYGTRLREAISTNGGHLDLAILGVGGTNNNEDDDSIEIYGGHIAFNEPGSDRTQSAHMVKLTEKTRKDTAYRFKSLANLIRIGELDASLSTEVPTHAMTLGLADILQADTILLMATGDEKAPALQKAFASPNNPDIPVSFLVGNINVLWLLDESAAKTLPDYVRRRDFITLFPPDQLSELVSEAVKTSEQFFPRDENVLIISPHPDDDVISMGASIVYLKQRGCEVHIAYAVTGSNAVRPEGDLYDEGLRLAMESPEAKDSEEDLDSTTIEMRAKAWVRRKEAEHATALLGIPPENLEFLDCDYYNRRGVEGIDAITDSDLRKMMNVITSSSPKHIFFAAENDPHGAHGLAAELLAKALEKMPDIDATLWGYRGAYAEWPLRGAKRLSIIPFDTELMDLKVRSIKEHVSQLKPLYPSFDPREFYERATDRNRAFAQQVVNIIGHPLGAMDSTDGKHNANYAEAFRRYTKEEFIKNNIG